MSEHLTNTNTLLGLETDLLNASKRKDLNFLEGILADSFIEIGKSGRTYTKQEIIALLLNEERPSTLSVISDFSVRPLSDDLFLTTYQLAHDHSMRSSIWQQADTWTMIFHQGTIRQK